MRQKDNYENNSEICVGFEALKEMKIGEILELENKLIGYNKK